MSRARAPGLADDQIGALLRRVASAGIWLPTVLVGYFALRAIHAPGWVGPGLLAGFAGVAAIRRFRTAPADVAARAVPNALSDWALLLACLSILVAPGVRLAVSLGTGDHASAFLFSDEAFNLKVAQALAAGFPPDDLSYSGRLLRYHLGGPLLVEMLHRYSSVAMHAIFYGVLPVALRVLTASSVYCVLSAVFRDWDTRRKLIAVLSVGGVFLIDFYNVAWNVRNIALGSSLAPDTVLGGMPIGQRLPGFASFDVYYGASLAVAFFWILLANLDRGVAHLACALVAIFLTKASVFLPIGVAWAGLAGHQLLRARSAHFFWAGVLALASCLAARAVVLEPGLVTLELGHGVGYGMLADHGRGLAHALRLESSGAVLLLGVLGLALGTHSYGVAAARVMMNTEARGRYARNPIVILCLATAVAASAYLVGCVFNIEPQAQERFADVHASIRGRLWMPLDGYLQQIWNMSIAAALPLLGGIVALFATGAAFHAYDLSRSKLSRGAFALSLAVALSVTVAGALGAAAGPSPATTKRVSADAVAALGSIPVDGSLLLSNDCSYDPVVERHLPLMNAWAPALFGHRFWACDFMFNNNFAADDASARLQKSASFWASSFGSEEHAFLVERRITHLLLDLRAVGADAIRSKLDSTSWLQTAYRGEEYAVYEVRMR